MVGVHPYRWSESIEPRLQQATERMRRLRATRMPPAAIQSLRHWFRIHHTYNSNAIEGNRLTLPETRAVVEDGITIAGKSLKDHFEAVNLAHALDFVEGLASKDSVLNERDVREMHGIVLRGIDPENAGAYRPTNVWIGGTTHVPPEAVRVPEEMRAFGEWLAGAKTEHPVVVCAIAHAWFETIHPFVDGNGRTGRLLANLLLMREHFPAIVLLVEDRARYYTALDASHSGDITAMVELTLDRLDQSFEEYERAAREVIEVREPAIDYLAEQLGKTEASHSFQPDQWNEAVRALHAAIRDFAVQLEARSAKGQRPRLGVSDFTVLPKAAWDAFPLRRYELFHLHGEHQGNQLVLSIRAVPKTGRAPVLRVDEPDDVSEAQRSIMSMEPTGHTFRVTRGDGLATQIEHGVSALRLATELWTHAINTQLLAP
ncbi:Fic family protein [Corallococcus aberystwythensis]|uniref:Fic family protein n=1 Tax=Corallococcus aberystwythensis TaxID=2316722 RepID=A0A3A8QLD2_9BACT|nr:Fic family protein [Corallococcus aberystwythensis]RKH65652.1 Fic family protein [Corallococcus aberystwythensis]